jgi:ABC-type microcin C transport system permease subunit YejE
MRRGGGGRRSEGGTVGIATELRHSLLVESWGGLPCVRLLLLVCMQVLEGMQGVLLVWLLVQAVRR